MSSGGFSYRILIVLVLAATACTSGDSSSSAGQQSSVNSSVDVRSFEGTYQLVVSNVAVTGTDAWASPVVEQSGTTLSVRQGPDSTDAFTVELGAGGNLQVSCFDEKCEFTITGFAARTLTTPAEGAQVVGGVNTALQGVDVCGSPLPAGLGVVAAPVLNASGEVSQFGYRDTYSDGVPGSGCYQLTFDLQLTRVAG